jgi:ArsR family transcriptional regulator, arsenate/arsenite/antimonite-responsive transcriptional repressor
MATVAISNASFEVDMPTYEMPEGLRDNVLQLCRMLGDATRLRIAYYLTNEAELNVSELCDRVAQSQPAVSHHLAMMRTHGLVDARRAGRRIYYSLQSDVLRRTLEQLFRTRND